jgi:hypothetical protein
VICRPRPGARGAGLAAVAAATLAGCFADPTEVVVVVDTDAKVGRDFSEVDFCFSPAPQGPPQPTADGSQWPVTVGVRPQSQTTFSLMVRLSPTPGAPCPPSGSMGPDQLAFATRSAADVRFVPGEMRVLFLPILSVCACVNAAGMPITGCTHALDPGCQDLSDPPLGDFDPNNIPHLPASSGSSP